MFIADLFITVKNGKQNKWSSTDKQILTNLYNGIVNKERNKKGMRGIKERNIVNKSM